MRFVLFAALAALAIPSSTYAGDRRNDDHKVRLIIECSPKTAAAIEHLLAGSPAKIYRAEPTSPPVVRRPAKSKAMPTGVVSVLPIWNAIEKAVGAQPGPMTIQKMTLSARSARFTVVTNDHEALLGLRRTLESMPEVKSRARNAKSPVDLGPATKFRERLKGEFTISLQEIASTEQARAEGSYLWAPDVLAARKDSGVVLFRQGREDRTEQDDHVRISTESVFQPTTLPILRKYVIALTAVKGVAPVEVRWQLRDAEKRGADDTLIQKPTVKIAQWMTR